MQANFPNVPLHQKGFVLDQISQILKSFITIHDKLFNKEPDERGVTALFLTHLQFIGPQFNIDLPSQKAEATGGYDYAIRYSDNNGNHAQPLRIELLLQAKFVKPDRYNAEPRINFLYKSSDGQFQVDILQKQVLAEQAVDPDVRVVGGYILYNTDAIHFVPIGDVLHAKTAAMIRDDVPTLAECERNMTRTLIGDGDLHPLRDMATYPLQ